MPTLPTNPHYVGDSGHVNDHNTIVTALAAGAFISGSVLTNQAGTTMGAYSAWTSFSPTITSSAGAITTSSVIEAKYLQLGKTVIARYRVQVTTAGSGNAGALQFTLPTNATAANSGFGMFRENVTSGKMCQAIITGTNQLTLWAYDGGGTCYSGWQVIGGAIYEAA